MKIKNFMKYFKEGGLEIFQNFREIVKYFKVKYFIVHLYLQYRIKQQFTRPLTIWQSEHNHNK